MSIQNPSRIGRVVTRDTNEGVTVYQPETDTLHILNPTAYAIWELCDGSTAPLEIARAIGEVTGMDEDAATEVVATTLHTFGTIRLISYIG